MQIMYDREFYLVVGKGRGYGQLSVPDVRTKKPAIPRGKIAIRVRLEIPESLFEEFIPQGTITLPEDASVGRPEVVVEVPDALHVTPEVRFQLVPIEEEA